MPFYRSQLLGTGSLRLKVLVRLRITCWPWQQLLLAFWTICLIHHQSLSIQVFPWISTAWHGWGPEYWKCWWYEATRWPRQQVDRGNNYGLPSEPPKMFDSPPCSIICSPVLICSGLSIDLDCFATDPEDWRCWGYEATRWPWQQLWVAF